jgi:hypothetical protein
MRTSTRRSLLEALWRNDDARALETLVDGHAPRPFEIQTVAFAERLGPSSEAAVRRGILVRCGSGLARPSTIADLATRARRLVADHLSATPLDRGMPLAALRAALAREAGPEAAAAAVLAARARRGPDDVDVLTVDGDTVLFALRSESLPATASARLARTRSLLADAGPHGMTVAHLAGRLACATAETRALLAVLERERSAVGAGELWFTRGLVDDVRAKILEHLAQNASITVLEAKALCGLPRRQAIALLEAFDEARLTRRVGDVRVRGAGVTK